MGSTDHQSGAISALIVRFTHERLPRVMSMQVRVHRGECLGEFDIQYLERVIRDMRRLQRMTDNNPRYQQLYTRVVGLYVDVTTTALENERQGGDR